MRYDDENKLYIGQREVTKEEYDKEFRHKTDRKKQFLSNIDIHFMSFCFYM